MPGGRAGLLVMLFFVAACGKGDGDLIDAGTPDAPPSDAMPDAGIDASTGGGVGDPCTGTFPEQGTCQAGLMCISIGTTFPGGYCSKTCSDDNGCPTDATCGVLDPSLGMVCMKRCDDPTDCRAGYACSVTELGCIVSGSVFGARDDGGACYTVAPGPYQLDPPPRVVFAGANLDMSTARTDSLLQAEGNVVVSPTTGAIVVPYIAALIGASFIGTSSLATPTSTPVFATIAETGRSMSDPVLAYTPDGVLHLVYLSFVRNTFGNPTEMHVRVVSSLDDGVTWGAPVTVDPPGVCSDICDKPWLAVGRHPIDPLVPSLYVAYNQQSATATNGIYVQRSDDQGAIWSAPVALPTTINKAANLTAPAVAADGTLYVAWFELFDNPLGSTLAEVKWAVSTDGGATFTSGRASRSGDSLPFMSPAIALTDNGFHIAYIRGDMGGHWDVILATSLDGGASWAYRKVNDEPDSCATHAWPALTPDADGGSVHAAWIENRYGPGATVYARCPEDGAVPCGLNEAVSDADYEFTIRRNDQRWLGDYGGIIHGASLWTGWTDNRTGRAAFYLAEGPTP